MNSLAMAPVDSKPFYWHVPVRESWARKFWSTLFLQPSFSFHHSSSPLSGSVSEWSGTFGWFVLCLWNRKKEKEQTALFLEYAGSVLSRWNSRVCRAHSLGSWDQRALALLYWVLFLIPKWVIAISIFPAHKKHLQPKIKKKEVRKQKTAKILHF